jgi:hypothetical protein
MPVLLIPVILIGLAAKVANRNFLYKHLIVDSKNDNTLSDLVDQMILQMNNYTDRGLQGHDIKEDKKRAAHA